ncbi:MAG TPA: hypothetical protein VD837_18270 [Terriglobales bacterium]|nr:hypothetical protein [Terriglobales bacterium]
MNSHLTDEQITDWLLDTAAPEVRQHMKSCSECSSEAMNLKRVVSGFAQLTQHEAAKVQLNRPAFVHRAAAPATHRLVWVAAMVLFALGIVLLTVSPLPDSRTAMAPDAALIEESGRMAYDGDDALLLSIQRDLDSDMPEALAPVAILTAERNRAILRMSSMTEEATSE